MPRALCRTITVYMLAMAACSLGAQTADPPAVFTRAQLVSVFEEPDGKLYVRLKLLPRSKLPFATLSFRVAERSLVAGIAEGAWVKFGAQRIDGENTVTALHAVAECKRFQPCD